MLKKKDNHNQHFEIYFLCTFLFLIILVLIIVKIVNTPEIILSYVDNNQLNIIKVNKGEEKIKQTYQNYPYVKIDIIDKKEPITLDELEELISKTITNKFSYSLLINKEIILLKEEINTNYLFDYDKDTINEAAIKRYIDARDQQYFAKIDTIELLTTTSKYLENDKFILLNNANGYTKRDDNYYEDNLDTIIKNAASLLSDMILDNGKYIYGYNTNNKQIIAGYNTLRHAGSTWSLIKYYEKNPSSDLKEKIDISIDYLIDNYLVNFNKSTSYIMENNNIKLGGNGLALVMLSDYELIMKDDKYHDIATKLANGIKRLQKKDGSYSHILDDKFQVKTEFSTVYYDGEATLGLLKYYALTKDTKMMNVITKAIDYFIKNNYEKYSDHWLTYVMFEFLKYQNNEKYINFALNNFTYNREKFNTSTTFSPTRVENLTNTFKIYKLLKEAKISNKELLKFNLNNLTNTLKNNVKILFNYYVTPEIGMYYANPSSALNVIGGFNDTNNEFRMRIDDIQHSILGLMTYQDIKKYIEE